MEIIGVAGKKSKSGKTTVVENLVRELKVRGLRVGTLKHIPKDDFTIDTEGTDTWKHARAGADLVVALSKNEAAFLVPSEREIPLEEAVEDVGALMDLDYLIVEGFKKADMPRIVVAASVEDAKDMVDENTIAVSGLLAAEGGVDLETDVPIIDAVKEAEKLADLIDASEKRLERILRSLPGLDCGECGKTDCREMAEGILAGEAGFADCVVLSTSDIVSLQVGEHKVQMGSFVQDFVKNSIIGMVKSLKGTDMAPGDVLEIKIPIKEDDL